MINHGQSSNTYLPLLVYVFFMYYWLIVVV